MWIYFDVVVHTFNFLQTNLKHQIFMCTMHMYLCHAGSNPVDSKFKAFLAWQTWDLLRIMWQGLKLLCRNFTTQNPGYYISPFRLNGSAVKTLFSQLKFISHGDLSATRYPQALASLMTKGSIRGQKVAGSCSYRDAALYVCQYELTKHSNKGL